jgi:hypothetical protein
MKIFTDIWVAPVTNGDQKQILVTNLALTKNNLVAPFYGNRNFSITIEGGRRRFSKKYDMPPFPSN